MSYAHRNQEVDMSNLSTDKKPLVDYGVQIRFIKDLHDTGGGYSDKSRTNGTAAPPSNKYGVAVRVQGISGQPYVVLKDGEKGDSYGVQLNTPSPTPGPPSPVSSLTRPSKEPAEVSNPYSPAAGATHSPASPADDEDGEIFGSPLKRPPGDGQAGTQGEEEGDTGRDGDANKSKAEPQVKAATKAAKNKDLLHEGEYNEAGLKPVRLNGVEPTRGKAPSFGVTSSLGRKVEKSTPQFEPPATAQDEPVSPVDTNPLTPITKLISKFNNGTTGGGQQARGRSGARQRLKFDQRTRSRSLDARKDVEPSASRASPPSPAVNPYAAPLSSSASVGPAKGSASVSNATTVEAPKQSFTLPGKSVEKQTAAAVRKPAIPPRTMNPSAVVSREGSPIKQATFSILKDDGPPDSEASLKRKADLIYETTNTYKGDTDGSFKKENHTLQEQVSHFRKELQQAHDELAMERMSREAAESRLHLLEDQLAELQEELRRVSETSFHPDSLQTDVMTLQADLAEATMLRQRQEETLRLRERELTALKGALKEEVECHDKEMEALREQYSQDMDSLRSTMEEFTQSQDKIEEERERVNASIVSLEEELESCRDQGKQWKMQLQSTSQESRNHINYEMLQQTRLAKDERERELKELQDSLLAMKKQAPASDSSSRELQDALRQAQADLDKQRRELNEKKEELQGLKRASSEKEAELLSEVRRLKEQSLRDKAELEKAVERAKESGKAGADHAMSQELQEANARLRERLARMSKLHSSAPRSSEAEEAMEVLEDENRSLKSQLEEAKRGANRLSKERDELSQRLEERDLEREVLKRGKSDLEEQKRLLDRALEKINKEMEMMMEDSRQSVAALQSQLDDYRERSRKDLQEVQRNNKDRLVELQRAQNNLKAQQDEVSRLKKELLVCCEERDSAQLERDLLNNRFKHLETELEAEKSAHTERTREVRSLEDKIKTLEIELDEERSSLELLNDRISRSRDQVDQLRSELMQERSERHDLEMDKSALERQLKELKSRIADMEGQARPSAGLTLLESKVQELEERLRSEEREKSSILASQRRMERKLKELNATLDQERIQHVEQRDQLSLRVKALKRQVDESEGEVERLEGVRRKVLRDLEEQQELREALHAKVSALENELKRKSLHTHRTSLGAAALSSEDEDGFYDTNISSILNESHLQSSNC
uniref:Cingulin b n=1 Tax=Takifugu rubripes TaxID=31033 RepID=A0A674NLQ5_TAKRU